MNFNDLIKFLFQEKRFSDELKRKEFILLYNKLQPFTKYHATFYVFTTSATELDYYHQKLNVGVA